MPLPDEMNFRWYKKYFSGTGYFLKTEYILYFNCTKKTFSMTKKFLYSAALSGGLFFLLCITSALDGRWTGMIQTPDGNSLDVVYNFKTSGDTLTGTAASPAGEVSIDNGKVSGDNFSFEVTVDGNVYPHKGVLYTDSCGLDIDFGAGAIVHTTIIRDKTSQ
jgi:hypothetical protein